MKTMTLKAPAKVNYRLDVIARRPDGYHELCMVMQPIDLCDDIVITLSDRAGIRVRCDRDGVPDGPGNIAWRAADALLSLTDGSRGLDIDIAKRIPVAAGLGGGSSDAASVLMGVNELLGLGLSRERLMEIGVTLGADVPFFIIRGPAVAEGIGEVLTPIHVMPQVWLVLVNPGFPVSTAWVYQNLQLTKKSDNYNIPRFYEGIDDVCSVLANDLEAVTIGKYPVLADIKESLVACGAVGALMSGSGPTVFGLFSDEAVARRCEAELSRNSGWFVAAIRSLAG